VALLLAALRAALAGAVSERVWAARPAFDVML
jgi:hypothetical protein